jgi:hypothetical protein
VNFLRRGATAPTGGDDEDDEDVPPVSETSGIAEDEPLQSGTTTAATTTARTTTAGTGRQASTPPQTERQQKAAQRASRMDLVRQARKASSAMQDPEPVRGLLVAGFLVAVGLLSYFATDVEQVSEKVHGKTQVVSQTITHPATAVLLVVVAVVCAVTIYWRRRYVTGIAFMIAAAIGIGAPLPKNLSDLMWLTFLVPAGYVLWLLMFRMNKEQKAWLAAHGASSQSAGGSSSGATSTKKSQRGQPGASGSRSRKKNEVAVSATGRRLPENSGRYTRPQSKPKAGQRRS